MKICVIALLTIILSSCEYEAHLTYKIRNSTASTIKVISEHTDNNTITDTFLIAPNDETTIAVIQKGLAAVGFYKEKDEKLSDFSKMDIYKSDTTKAITDFLETARWKYNKTSNHSADYKLTVLPADF